MSEASSEAVLESGVLLLSDELVETLPEEPAHYRLRSSGQRVMYVGHAGEEGLRRAVRDVCRSQAMAGISSLEYSLTTSAEAAEAANQEIQGLKPLYNEGFGRFRNADMSLPKKGHRIRKAMHNP